MRPNYCYGPDPADDRGLTVCPTCTSVSVENMGDELVCRADDCDYSVRINEDVEVV